jgi:hypothetical protein
LFTARRTPSHPPCPHAPQSRDGRARGWPETSTRSPT